MTSITMDDFKHRRSNFIRTNEDKTAIAIFKKEEDSYQLEKIYSLETYYFESQYGLERSYKELFNKKEKIFSKRRGK